MAPLFSIVTPCLNSADFIGQALDSVRVQGAAGVEHIVVDGGSTDATLEIVARYPTVRLLRGPDRGLYDAINKGIAASSGRLIGLLNSDDLYCPDAIASAARVFEANPEADVVSGGAEFFTSEGGTDRVVTRAVDEATRILAEAVVIQGGPIINARFFRRSVFDRVGPFDLRFPVASDRDFLFRCRLEPLSMAGLDAVLYRYRMHSRSLTLGASGVDVRLLKANLEVARTRLAERRTTPHAAAYRRWHAWATGRLLIDHGLRRRWTEATDLAAAATGIDPLWPGRFAGQLVRRRRSTG